MCIIASSHTRISFFYFLSNDENSELIVSPVNESKSHQRMFEQIVAMMIKYLGSSVSDWITITALFAAEK